jgi:hypothetical protein
VALVWSGTLFYISLRPLDKVAWNGVTWLVSLSAFLATLAIWWLNNSYGQYREVHLPIIGLDASLEALVANDLSRTVKQHRPTPILSEVGVMVRSLKKSDVNAFDASGVIWQRLPRDRPQGVTHGLFFMIYLLLFINCWLGAAIAGGNSLLSQRDGRIIKQGYWPLVMTTMYLITFMNFYVSM